MKTCAILLLSALGLLLLLAPVSAGPSISLTQSVNFTANGFLYWAMIYDYTWGTRESDTGGFIDVDRTLTYSLVALGEIHVAYMYDQTLGHYNEALALRDIDLRPSP